jgi:hypothetical protein
MRLQRTEETLFAVKTCVQLLLKWLAGGAIKRRDWPMIGFKSFRCVCVIRSGIEVVLMVRKGQLSGDYNRSAVA